MVKVRRAQIMRGTEQRSSTKLGPHLECGDLSPLLWLADVSARQGAFGARRTSSGEEFVPIRRRQVAFRYRRQVSALQIRKPAQIILTLGEGDGNSPRIPS